MVIREQKFEICQQGNMQRVIEHLRVRVVKIYHSLDRQLALCTFLGLIDLNSDKLVVFSFNDNKNKYEFNK